MRHAPEKHCGGHAEFERLCAETEAPLYSYALKMSGNASEAEEIAQESLFRLFKALRNGSTHQAPRAYLFSIAHNLAMDTHRRTHREPPPEPPSPPTPAASASRSLLREQIDLALEDLPENQRAALLLREFGALRYGEIAETLGVAEGQVKIWIYRGRKRLAELLDRDGQYVGKHADGH